MLVFLLRRLIGPVLIIVGATALTAQVGPSSITKEQQLARLENALRQNDRTGWFDAGVAYVQMDSLEKARQIMHRVITADGGEEIVDSLTGLAWHTIGMTHYLREEDDLAIEPYREAVRVRDAVFDGPHFHQAHSRFNLAFSYRWTNQPEAALQTLHEALELYRVMPKKDSTNWIRSLRLTTILAKDNYDKHLQRAATVALDRMADEYTRIEPRDHSDARYAAAQSYLDLGEYVLAEEQVEQAIALGTKSGAWNYVADMVNIKANILFRAGFFERAVREYRRSIELLKKIEGNPSSINIAYHNMARCYLRDGQFRQAKRFFLQSEKYPYNDVPATPIEALNLLAEIEEALGNVDAAMAAVNRAVAMLDGSPVEAERVGDFNVAPDSLKLHDEAATVYAMRARLLANEKRFDEAIADVHRALNMRERQRAEVSSDASRYALSRKTFEVYDLGVSILMQAAAENDDPEKRLAAFRMSEAGRAYSLLAGLNDAGGADSRVRALRWEIADLERAVAEDKSESKTLADRELELELLLRSRQRPTTPLPEFSGEDYLSRWLQPERAALLEYHVGRKASYAFYLPPDGRMRTWRVPPATELLILVEDFRAALFDATYQGKSLRSNEEQERLDTAYAGARERLNAAIFPAGWDWSVSGIEKLYFSPDASLHFVPLTALAPAVDALPPTQRIASGRFYLSKARRPGADHALDVLAFAPSYAGNAAPAAYAELRGARGGRQFLPGKEEDFPLLSALRYNEKEVEQITAGLRRVRTFRGEAATRANFIRSLDQDPAVLHVSSHGYYQPDAPRFSWLAFTQGRREVPEQDLIYFNDLAAMPVSADLVVLSACETSVGNPVPGEAAQSLGNAFIAAGARSTLTSLWKVDDLATKELMTVFYAGLREGLPREVALRRAQRSLAESAEYANPYFWSGFVLSGQSGPVALDVAQPGSFNWYLAVGLVVLLLVIGNIYWSRRGA